MASTQTAAQRNHKKKKTGVVAVVEPGTLVWIPDTETGQVWVKAEVVSIEVMKNSVRVKTDDGSERGAPLDKLLRCNGDTWQAESGLTAVNDLSSLTHLHEPEVLQALQLRFDIDKIYTFCGPILIVLNPFKSIAGIYNNFPPDIPGENEEPHIFLVARKAFGNLMGKLQSQVVLISGESGAGKTESTKHVLKFLTTKIAKVDGINPDSEDSVLKKVLSSNPVLEAFGNACTTRNDNSSRFGKFIELQFENKSNEAKFVCAAIDTYLLEKVRITETQKRERSYHIFYQACFALQRFGKVHKGLPLDLFRDATEFKYLTKSDRIELDNNDDAELFEETIQAMETMGFSSDEILHIIHLVASVLHIGNIPIVQKGSNAEVKADNDSFLLVSKLLGISPEVLSKALTFKLISVSASEKYDSPLTLAQSESLRESFSRALYSLLFNFVVHRVNSSLAGSAKSSNGGTKFFSGVLDIFGFEHFEKNSFEQLCINFANERLQQLFNQFVFKSEMDLYKSENVQCDFSDFPDNQDIIDMIQGKQSVLTALDEECRLPKGSDQSFVQKLWKTFEKHKRFKIEPRKPSCFSVVHFAGVVSYDTAHFMEKNMDELGELLKQAMEQSTAPIVVAILDLKREKDAASAALAAANSKAGPGRGAKKPNTVSTDFKGQLDCLMTKMGSASPHFVRCIKPNPEKRPDRYDRQSVAEQLRSGGVIEALCVQRAGYPCRWSHGECWDNIGIMFKVDQRQQFIKMEMGERIHAALTQLAKELKWPAAPGASFAIGKSKIFFKQGPFEVLESARVSILNEAACRIQSAWKRYNFRKIFCLIRKAACFVQASIRKYIARKKLWNSMDDGQRRKSRLFKNVNEVAKAALKHVRAGGTLNDPDDALSDVSEVADLGEGAPAPAAAVARISAAPPPEMIEQMQVEKEAQEQKFEAERQAMKEEMKQKLDDQARQITELQTAERKWQEAERQLKSEHEDECKRITVRVQAEEASKRGQVEQQLQSLRREADVRKAECDQQVALAQLRQQEAKSRVDELEREVKRLKDEMGSQSERHATTIQELHAAHVVALSNAAEQHEEQRDAYLKQIDDMREQIDEVHRSNTETAKQHEMEHAARFQTEVQHLRQRESQQRAKHEAELAELRKKETERSKKLQTEMTEAKRNESDNRLQVQILEQQLHDLKADAAQHKKILEGQFEEAKRMQDNQLEMLNQRHEEREGALKKELEVCQAQKGEQVQALRNQLEFQKREIFMTSQQEVGMMKHQWEQRERQLIQMLNQARIGQAEREKTAEVQLQLKAQQQDELYRCADAKARHLEESARRQQELYEQHVEQLTQAMRDSQESFRNQLEEAQKQNDSRLAASVQQLANLEAQMKEDQEKRQAAQESEREGMAFKMHEMSRLQDKVVELEKTNKELLIQLKKGRTTRFQEPGEAGGDRGSVSRPQLLRRMSEPVPSLSRDGSNQSQKAKIPLRVQLGPKRMSLAVQDAPARGSFTSEEPVGPRKSMAFDSRKSIMDLMGQPKRSSASSLPTNEVLAPTLMDEVGQEVQGDVGMWQQVAAVPASFGGKQADSAITVLTFAEPLANQNHWLMAAASKSGTLTVYQVKMTAIERGATSDLPGPDVEVKIQITAHAKAITSMSFSKSALELMTTSSDWHVRIWNVETGDLKNRFVDSSLVVCALPMSGPDWSMVMANAGAVLRLISADGSQRQQKVRLDHYARSMVLALDNTRLLAGTSRGHIHALDVDDTGLKIIGKQQVSSQAALTCLVVAPCGDGMPPLVVANSMDNTVCVLQANAQMTNFTVLKRIPNPHKLLPLRCCHVASFGTTTNQAGFVATASEDGAIHIIDLDSFQEMKLHGHGIAVVDTAVTSNSGLLVSGDVHGRIILWRCGAKGNQLTNGR